VPPEGNDARGVTAVEYEGFELSLGPKVGVSRRPDLNSTSKKANGTRTPRWHLHHCGLTTRDFSQTQDAPPAPHLASMSMDADIKRIAGRREQWSTRSHLEDLERATGTARTRPTSAVDLSPAWPGHRSTTPRSITSRTVNAAFPPGAAAPANQVSARATTDRTPATAHQPIPARPRRGARKESGGMQTASSRA
jgi:hypothetical protein